MGRKRADILDSSNIPTSFTAFKRQQAAHDDSFNFRSQLLAETPTPLRIFEIADRVASGGFVDAETDFPVIGWFLKLVAACPSMSLDEHELEEKESNGGSAKKDSPPGLDRIVGAGASEIAKQHIEDDDIIAITAAKQEFDDATGGQETLKGDLTISIIEGSDIAKSEANAKEQSKYRIRVKDDFNGLHIIPATSSMTLNELKQEALRRYGITDFIDRHDLCGIDQDS
ncbi:hypothetical protein HDU98_004554, partial [Podochytrium sp. JEL0797]